MNNLKLNKKKPKLRIKIEIKLDKAVFMVFKTSFY